VTSEVRREASEAEEREGSDGGTRRSKTDETA
jgi:hypothetical protein